MGKPRLDPKVAEAVMLKAGLKPLEPYTNSHAKWKCQCLKCKRIITPRYHDVQQDGSSCGYCSGNLVDPKVAEAVMLKAGLKPLEPYTNSHAKWKCLHISCGEIVSTTHHQIINGQGGCRPCGLIRSGNSRKLDPKVAEAVMLKAKLKPLEPYTNSQAKWKCQCLKCKRIVNPRYTSIKAGQGGCEHCGTASSMKKNLIPNSQAVAIMEKANLKPLEPYKKGSSRWKCKCMNCGKIVYPNYSNIQTGRGGCRPCGLLKSGKARRIDEEKAFEIMLEAKLKPLEPYNGANASWKCQCLRCKRIITPSYAQVKRRGSGCQYCGKNKVDPKEAEELMQKAKLKPLEPFKNAKHKWKCKCLKCNEIVYPNLKGVRQGEGCSNCATGGINQIDPAYIYLITHFELNSHKIGIANVRKIDHRDRLNQFKAKGWQTFQVWQIKTGLDALNIETSVFKILRKEMNLPSYLSEKEMPITGGWSETVGADSISLVELEKIINKVIKGLKK